MNYSNFPHQYDISLSLNFLPFLTSATSLSLPPFPIFSLLLSGRKVNRSIFYIPYNKLSPLTLQVFKEERYLNDALSVCGRDQLCGLLKRVWAVSRHCRECLYAFTVCTSSRRMLKIPVQGL